VVFDKYCNSVVFQTNINNSDDVDALLIDVESGVFEDRFCKALVEKFNECYEDVINGKLSENKIKEYLNKLKFEADVQYLKEGNNNFRPLVGEKIYEYSEVDLGRLELEEIILKLLDLIERKSSSIIKEITPESIEKYAGVSIDDLLSVLSISKDAYYNLLDGGDSKAVKSASIIQRTLQSAGSGIQEIEYCTRCKTNWDLWFRKNRHLISELDLNAITQSVKKLFSDMVSFDNQVLIASLKGPIEEAVNDLESKKLLYDLNEDLLLGAFFSELVKVKS
jgi:Fe-S cluster biosynthesis and repair protein YggX